MTGPENFTDLLDHITEALKSWDLVAYDPEPLLSLELIRRALRRDPTLSARVVVNQLLQDCVAELERRHLGSAEILTRRFMDNEKMRSIANSLNVSEATAFRRQAEALEQLTTIVEARETEARERRQAIWEKRLERPTYTRLIGAEPHLAALADLMTKPEHPWLVSIEGMGGLGKTSLADALAREVIANRQFDDFAWVSARPQTFRLDGQMQPVAAPTLTSAGLIEALTAQLMPTLLSSTPLGETELFKLLQRRLKRSPHLVIIDNLETMQDVEELLPTLRELANPTKFLLTSRRSLRHGSTIYHFPLPELSQADAIELIQLEIETHNLHYLRSASAADLKRVYRAVGGNPLALRLVVGQTHIFSLDVILADLTQAQSQTVEDLYTYIYRRAWNALDEPTRVLFLAMPLVTEHGEPFQGLVEISGLDVSTAHRSLKHLVNLNLVNGSGDHAERYYSIHNLTRTFLQEQVLKWT